jgi:tRNA(His) 5'-end guanylyltransferase
MDSDSLSFLLKKSKSTTCPIGGCGKMWSKESSSIDKKFLMIMERFFRLQTLPGSDSRGGILSSSQNPGTEIVLDDD